MITLVVATLMGKMMINHTHFGPSKPFGFSMILHIMCLVVFFFLWVIFSVEIPSMGRLAFWDDFGGIYWGNSKRLSIQMQLQDAAGRFSGTVIKHGVLEKSPLNSVIVSISVLPVRDFWVNVGVEKTMPFVHMIFLN